jgi:hypothetical protein
VERASVFDGNEGEKGLVLNIDSKRHAELLYKGEKDGRSGKNSWQNREGTGMDRAQMPLPGPGKRSKPQP